MPEGALRAGFAPVSGLARRALKGGLDLLFPPSCPACDTPVTAAGAVCAPCFSGFRHLEGPACAACGAPFAHAHPDGALCPACHADRPAFDRARAPLRYDDSSKRVVLALKRGDRLDLAPVLAGWMARAAPELVAGADLVVPVPLHWRRLLSRRHNQAGELARALGRLARLPVAAGLLVRTRPTPSQGEMRTPAARLRNVQGAFTVPERHRRRLAGRRVLVVDDVFTTGATLGACARALKRAGAVSVFALTAARVIPEER